MSQLILAAGETFDTAKVQENRPPLGPGSRPTLAPFTSCVLRPRLTRRFPSRSTHRFCLLLNFTQMESYYTLTGFCCLLVSDFFHSVFFEGWGWGEVHRILRCSCSLLFIFSLLLCSCRLFLLLHSRKIYYVIHHGVAPYVYLYIFPNAVSTVLLNHMYLSFEADVDLVDFQLVTIKECHWGQ